MSSEQDETRRKATWLALVEREEATTDKYVRGWLRARRVIPALPVLGIGLYAGDRGLIVAGVLIGIGSLLWRKRDP